MDCAKMPELSAARAGRGGTAALGRRHAEQNGILPQSIYFIFVYLCSDSSTCPTLPPMQDLARRQTKSDYYMIMMCG